MPLAVTYRQIKTNSGNSTYNNQIQ
jgi:hypothetical protein